jgi:hypothetical protein
MRALSRPIAYRDSESVDHYSQLDPRILLTITSLTSRPYPSFQAVVCLVVRSYVTIVFLPASYPSSAISSHTSCSLSGEKWRLDMPPWSCGVRLTGWELPGDSTYTSLRVFRGSTRPAGGTVKAIRPFDIVKSIGSMSDIYRQLGEDLDLPDQ